MTASDLQSIPAGEYMNPDQLAFFADRLSELYKETLAAQEASRTALAGLGVASDELDMALIEGERQDIARTLTRLEVRLKDIQYAQNLIQEGEYGWCESTGEEIGIARLLALPTARFSTASQVVQEAAVRQYRG